VDAYLDLMLTGISANGSTSASNIPMAPVGPTYHQAPAPGFGSMNCSSIACMATAWCGCSTRMLRLQAGPGEREFGRDWTLNTAAPRALEELFSERKTIYVRARYMLSGTRRMEPLGQLI